MNYHLIGEKNGKEAGMMLNIVAKDVEEIKKRLLDIKFSEYSSMIRLIIINNNIR